MTSEEERVRHFERRKRNIIAKELRQNKSFKLRTIPPKEKYKRIKLDPRNIEVEIDDE